MRHERFLPAMQMAHTDTGEDWAEAVAAMRGALQKPCNDFGYSVNDAYAVHDQMLWLPIGLAFAR